MVEYEFLGIIKLTNLKKGATFYRYVIILDNHSDEEIKQMGIKK